MKTSILDIEPQDLTFKLELKKQSSCSVRLNNNSHKQVAFKFKTTVPMKYSVRPNSGVIMPKSSCEITVTMQPQNSAPSDLVCNDKFLVQSTVVRGFMTDDITHDIFEKGRGKNIEERKLTVTINMVKGEELGENEVVTQEKIAKDPNVDSATKSLDLMQMTDAKLRAASDKPLRKQNHRSQMMQNLSWLRTKSLNLLRTQNHRQKAAKLDNAELIPSKLTTTEGINDVEKVELVMKIEDLKSKLVELESKLCEANITISKLTEEKRLSNQYSEAPTMI